MTEIGRLRVHPTRGPTQMMDAVSTTITSNAGDPPMSQATPPAMVENAMPAATPERALRAPSNLMDGSLLPPASTSMSET
ncbi:hypothetical protein [Agromyces badenianii]|uniref:hypothetical protein n=1 Tax=Agromyces badenianii TaxID=2080742 RepID=UPI001059CEAF|nr:hypothetical protein [Agromyces badenianii]